MKPPTDETRDDQGRAPWLIPAIGAVLAMAVLYVLSVGPVSAVATVHYGPNSRTFRNTYLAPIEWCSARSETVRSLQNRYRTNCLNAYYPVVLWWYTTPEKTGTSICDTDSAAPRR